MGSSNDTVALWIAAEQTAPRAATGGPRRRSGSQRPFQPYQLFFHLFLGGIALSAISSFAWVLNVSTKTSEEFISSLPWDVAAHWRWENYVSAWGSAHIGALLGNSVLMSVAAAVLAAVLSVSPRIPLARIPVRFNGLVLSLFLLGLIVPWMVIFAPMYLTLQDLGLLDSRLGLVLGYATYNLPFNVFVLVGLMKMLPFELEEAAGIDGPTRDFLSVILPLLGPGLASVALIRFLQKAGLTAGAIKG